MKKYLLGTVALIAFAAPAAAADMAARPYTKAPAADDRRRVRLERLLHRRQRRLGFEPQVLGHQQQWRRRVAPVAAEGCHDATGGAAGGQIGYRWQAGTWVFGLEAQGNWADFSGSNTSLFFPAPAPIVRIDAFGLFTGQIGCAGNNALLYVKGGAAVTDGQLPRLLMRPCGPCCRHGVR